MRVALAHDYLTQYGGAERVLETLHDHWPEAPVFTSLYEPAKLPESMQHWDIRESAIAQIPWARRSHRAWLPIYPAIFGQIGQSVGNVDAVIADSSAWSHHARPTNRIPLLVYCHSPARFLYRDRHYLGANGSTSMLGPMVDAAFGPLRKMDRRAARCANRYVANSQAVAQRIANAYGIEARVIHPPVDVFRFTPAEERVPEDWFLIVSRLVPHKWIDRAIRASNRTGYRLKVVGTGRAEPALRQLAGPTVEFVGQLSDDDVVTHMQRCKALILPGVEDFGMTVIEAQAAGRPVIAANGGGALETIEPGVTGVHFDAAREGSLDQAMRDVDSHHWNPSTIRQSTTRFAPTRFIAEIESELRDLLTRGD